MAAHRHHRRPPQPGDAGDAPAGGALRRRDRWQHSRTPAGQGAAAHRDRASLRRQRPRRGACGDGHDGDGLVRRSWTAGHVVREPSGGAGTGRRGESPGQRNDRVTEGRTRGNARGRDHRRDHPRKPGWGGCTSSGLPERCEKQRGGTTAAGGEATGARLAGKRPGGVSCRGRRGEPACQHQVPASTRTLRGRRPVTRASLAGPASAPSAVCSNSPVPSRLPRYTGTIATGAAPRNPGPPRALGAGAGGEGKFPG
jgi:hypothetical protein